MRRRAHDCLRLHCGKAHAPLEWRSVLMFDDAVAVTVERNGKGGKDRVGAYELMLRQTHEYKQLVNAYDIAKAQRAR